MHDTPTNRTPINRSKFRIPLQAVQLYERARKIYLAGGEAEWEQDGGLRTENLDPCTDLIRALGRTPWDESIFSTIDQDAAPDWMMDNADRVQRWRNAHAIRVELDLRLAEGCR